MRGVCYEKEENCVDIRCHDKVGVTMIIGCSRIDGGVKVIFNAIGLVSLSVALFIGIFRLTTNK